MKFFYCIKENNASHLAQFGFCPLVRLWQKKKWRLKPWTCDRRSWFALNSKTYERLFMRMPQIRNSQAWWIKYKRNDNSQQQPLIILGMAKWMVNGNESVKISKTLLTCCVLGKYDASYSCLFLGSYDTVEINFPIVKYLFRFLLLRNSNNETNGTLHMSFLNYLFTIEAKLGDLFIIKIIVIISFSIFFTFHTIPNYLKNNNPEWHIRISVKTAIDSNLY